MEQNKAIAETCQEAARKLTTYLKIYTGDKQAVRLAAELTNIASAFDVSAHAAVRGEAVGEELKLLHRGGHSLSTSGNGIAKSWMDELDQSREYMRSHGEKSSTSGAPAAANELVDSSKPPAGLDQREQMIWMMGRNSKESSVSVRAADAPSDLPTEILAKVMTRDDFNCSTELGYAQFLAWAIWLKSYCNVSPDFSIMDNLRGVLSQIDNMVCGLSRAADALDSQPTNGGVRNG